MPIEFSRISLSPPTTPEQIRTRFTVVGGPIPSALQTLGHPHHEPIAPLEQRHIAVGESPAEATIAQLRQNSPAADGSSR